MNKVFKSIVHTLTNFNKKNTQEEMYEYGYFWDGMIPLTKTQAIKEYISGGVIYRLYSNDAEGMIDNLQEVLDWDGFFGVEK